MLEVNMGIVIAVFNQIRNHVHILPLICLLLFIIYSNKDGATTSVDISSINVCFNSRHLDHNVTTYYFPTYLELITSLTIFLQVPYSSL